MSFEEQIKQWVYLDNQLKELNDKIKEIRLKRNIVEEKIIDHVSTNNLTNLTIKINEDKIKFVNTKVTEPLTFKYLENSLSDIIKNDTQLNSIIEHIRKKRTTKIIPEIKRFYNN
jgi:hypothetical protein